MTDRVRSVFLLLKHHYQSPVPVSPDTPLTQDLFEAFQTGSPGRHRYRRYAGMVRNIDNWQDRFFFCGFILPSREHMRNRHEPRNNLDLLLGYAVHPLVLVKRTAER